jgi:hypothetical protein
LFIESEKSLSLSSDIYLDCFIEYISLFLSLNPRHHGSFASNQEKMFVSLGGFRQERNGHGENVKHRINLMVNIREGKQKSLGMINDYGELIPI